MTAQTIEPRETAHPSIVRQLVVKDLRIMGVFTLFWWLLGVGSIVLTMFGGERMAMPSFILFLTALGGAAIHLVMSTVVEERREKTLAFVMSLPVTIREYTTAKVAFNLGLFGLVWLTLSAASFVVFIGDEGLPDGSIPFVVVMFVNILVAFVLILSVSLVTESIGWAIGAAAGGNIASQIFLWWIVGLPGISSVIRGPVPVWNATVLTILGCLIGTALLLLIGTYWVQGRKTEFV